MRAGAGPSTVGDVARFAGVEHSTASRLVERAVRAGYVERTADGRRAAPRLTERGLRPVAVPDRPGVTGPGTG